MTAMIWVLGNLVGKSAAFNVKRLVRTLMAYERFHHATQEGVVFGSRFGSVDKDVWLAPPPEKMDTASCLRVEEDRLEATRPTADVLNLRFHFVERATGADVKDPTQALKTSCERSRTCVSIVFLS
jgi:hypothetical protein